MRATRRNLQKWFFLGVVLALLGRNGFASADETTNAPKTGTVIGWGFNGGLIVMAGEKNELSEPVAVRGLDNIVALSAGGMHNLALRADGTVWVWGAAPRLDGLKNDGVPAQVPGLDHVIAVAAGHHHDLAVKSDGTVWTWGVNVAGEMGKPVITPPNEKPGQPASEAKIAANTATSPQMIKGLTKVIAAAAGDGLSVFLKSDGTVWACGANTEGQLGNGAVDQGLYHNPPVHGEPSQVKGLSNIVSLAVGDNRGGSGAVHILALDASGGVWGWGSSARVGATQEAKPSSAFLERDANGDVKTIRGKPPYATPVKVWGLPKVKAIAVSETYNLALTTDGKVYAWGTNGPGGISPRPQDELELDLAFQIKKQNSFDPKSVKRPDPSENKVELRYSAIPIEVTGLDRVSAIAVNRDSGFAMKSDGTVMAWGANDYSTLGCGKNSSGLSQTVEPVRVANLADAGGIAAASTYALAIRGKAGESFLAWYLEFSKLLRSRLDTINRIRGQAGMIATPLAELRANNLAIVKILQNPAKTIGIKDSAVAALREKLSRQSGEIHEKFRLLDELEAEGNRATKDILDHLGKGFDKYATPYLPDFLRWKKTYEGLAKRLPFELAIASGDEEKLRELAAKHKDSPLPTDLRVLVAKKLLSVGELAGALDYARTARDVDPNDKAARDTLREIQIVIISCALAKSQEAVGQARDAFEAYLTATGYPPRDYSKTRPLLVRMLLGPLDETNRAEIYALIVHGVVNVCDRVAGRLKGEELKLDKTTSEMTQKFLGLHMIKLLLNKKYGVEEIKAMVQTPNGIANAVPLNQPDGKAYTQAQINGLRMAMKSALEMEEIQALTNPSVNIKTALARAYFDKSTVADTAIDAFGAGLVSNAILLAVPMAEAYTVAGQSVSVTEMFAQALRWNKVMSWAGSTRAGEIMYNVLKREQRLGIWLLEKDLQLSFGALKGGEVVAFFMLQKAAADRAEMYGGPYMAAFTQAAIILSSDMALLSKWLKAGQIPRLTATRIVDKYIAEGEAMAKRIEAAHADRVKLRDLLEKKANGQTMSPEESEFIRSKMAANTSDHVPNGSPNHDSPFAEKVAAEEGQQGIQGDGKKVTEEFDNLAKSEGDDLKANVDKAKNAKGKITEASEPTPAIETLAYNPAKQAPGYWGPYEVPPSPTQGKNWAKAEEAMARGDYEEAKICYDKAVKANEMPDSMADISIARADEAAIASAARNAQPPLNPQAARRASEAMTRPIPPDTAEELLSARWSERVPLSKDKQGAISVVSQVPGREEYILKEIVPIPGKIEQGHLEQLGESEVVASVLAKELGIPYSGVAVRFIRNAEGGVESVRLLIRRINGEALNSLTSGEVFLYRRELAEAKAFSHMISDYDRKLDNFMICAEDGRIYYLDAGMADIRSAALGRGYPEIEFTNRGFLGIDHWYARSYKYADLNDGIMVHAPGSDSYIKSAKLHLAERSLTYNDAKPAVDRILRYMDPANEARLRDTLTKAYQAARGANDPNIGRYVDRAVETLRVRAGKLEEMMKCLNERNGRALPGADSPRLPDAAIPMPYVMALSFAACRRAA